MIQLASLRDASYITGNLRASDQVEVDCQLPDGFDHRVLAMQLVANGRAWVAYLDGRPAVLFGCSFLNAATASVWALGTDDMRRAMPEVTRFMLEHQVPWMIENGALTAEARSIVGHDDAHRWMVQSLGAEPHGPPFPYGKGGEMFQLFRWTVAGYRSIRDGTRS